MRGTRGERGEKVGHMETKPDSIDTGLSDLYKLPAECIFLFEKIQGETGNVGQAGLTGWPGHMVIKSRLFGTFQSFIVCQRSNIVGSHQIWQM